MDKFEIIKSLGILLLGIGVFVISIILYKIYQKTIVEEPFYVYCDNGYITIKANRDLKSIYILHENEIFCNYSIITKNSYKICDVRKFTENKTVVTFIISSYDFGERLVHCYNYLEVKRLN